MTPSPSRKPSRMPCGRLRSRLTPLTALTGPQYFLLAGSFLIPLGYSARTRP